jgi:hypothetical protein
MESQGRTIRVLCLHGMGTSGAIFRSQTGLSFLFTPSLVNVIMRQWRLDIPHLS